jgi:hypothetical protein
MSLNREWPSSDDGYVVSQQAGIQATRTGSKQRPSLLDSWSDGLDRPDRPTWETWRYCITWVWLRTGTEITAGTQIEREGHTPTHTDKSHLVSAQKKHTIWCSFLGHNSYSSLHKNTLRLYGLASLPFSGTGLHRQCLNGHATGRPCWLTMPHQWKCDLARCNPIRHLVISRPRMSVDGSYVNATRQSWFPIVELDWLTLYAASVSQLCPTFLHWFRCRLSLVLPPSLNYRAIS